MISSRWSRRKKDVFLKPLESRSGDLIKEGFGMTSDIILALLVLGATKPHKGQETNHDRIQMQGEPHGCLL